MTKPIADESIRQLFTNARTHHASIIKGAEEALAFVKGTADRKKYRVHVREEKRTDKKRSKNNEKS